MLTEVINPGLSLFVTLFGDHIRISIPVYVNGVFKNRKK